MQFIKKLRDLSRRKRKSKIKQQAITRSRAANSKKEVETKANQQTTTTTLECFNVCHQKYF